LNGTFAVSIATVVAVPTTAPTTIAAQPCSNNSKKITTGILKTVALLVILWIFFILTISALNTDT
jgi:amino acid permease